MNKIATFDIETNGFLPDVTRVWCAVVKDHETKDTTIFTPDNISTLCHNLETWDTLIGHNCIDYDLAVLRKIYNWEYKGKIIDTLLMSRLQRPNRSLPPNCTDRNTGPHSVKAWAYRVGERKQEHNEWDKFSPEMLERCKQDVDIQYKIYNALLKEGEGQGWEKAHKLTSKLFYILKKQEEYGWLIDKVALNRSIIILENWINRISKAIEPKLPIIIEPLETKTNGKYNFVRKPFKKNGELTETSKMFLSGFINEATINGPFSRINIRGVNLDKNMEVKSLLLNLGWKPLEWNVNDKGLHTSPKLSKDDPFDGIQGSLGRLVAKRIQCKQRKGVLEGWSLLIRPDGRIGAQVAGIATTGRIRHKGIVNVPSPNAKAFFARQMRALFIAKPGWVLVGTDSKGNQIRQLAARMGDEEFTKAVLFGSQEEGTDLHSLNWKKAGTKTRQLAKNFFYGFIFGAGDTKIGKIIGGTKEDGKRVKEEYLNGLPKLRILVDNATMSWRNTAQRWYNKLYNRMEYKNGYIRGLDGRPILVENEHTILVYYLQSDEAIQMATAYCMLYKWLEKAGYIWGKDWGYVIFMHDEWQIECKQEISEHVAKLGNEAIAWAGRYYNIACPHEGESKIGKNWYETH